MPRKRPARLAASRHRATLRDLLRTLDPGPGDGDERDPVIALLDHWTNDALNPDALLQDVITWLESERDTAHRGALLLLLARGPLWCGVAVVDLSEWDTPRVTALRDDVLAYLRSLVVHADDWTAEIEIRQPVRFSANVEHRAAPTSKTSNGVAVGVEGDPRDLVILQLQQVIQAVGLRNIAKCAAADCPHLFVKWYRRECCSIRCQKRHYKRQARQQELEDRARQEERRRRERARRA